MRGKDTTGTPPTAYSKHRDRAAKRARKQSAGQREIGPLPPIADPVRRARCEDDLQLALETYFPDVFALGWSSQHIEVIDALNQTLRFGGLFALGMPRGSGKTSLCVHAGLLAMLYGWRRYLVLIGATAEAAYEMLDTVKVQLETNDLLLADFPEICYPVQQLEGISQRSKGQLVNGEPTKIVWSGRKKIVLPTLVLPGDYGRVDGEKTGKGKRKAKGKGKGDGPGDPSYRGGGVIQAVGLLGRIRGMLHVGPDGDAIRPDCFLGDDLQTDDSARNVKQVERRETLLNGAVLGLSGPGKRIAGMCTVTIVRKGDLADRLLDRDLNPRYQGKKFSLVERWPEFLDLWEKYAELREIDLKMGAALLPRATKFYEANRKLMDKGHHVPWSARHEEHELSALQHAFNLKLANPISFEAEYQNNPTASNTVIGQVPYPHSDDIVHRTNGLEVGELPHWATHLFLTIDVQQDVLFYMLGALAEDFTGAIVDYGPWPPQPLGAYWTLGDLQVSLRDYTGTPDIAAAWVRGLNQLVNRICDKTYIRDDGTAMTVDQVMIDANYGDSSKSVYSICRSNAHRPLPFHGRGITAKQTPIAERKKKAGERSGAEWFMPSTKGTKMPRHVIADTNMVKTMVARRWLVPIGGGGDWTLYQAPIARHRMIADQLSAEYPIETHGRGRDLLEWQLFPGRDNHWLDCSVMLATLGLMAGCQPNKQHLAGFTAAGNTPKKERKSLAQMRAEAQAKRT